MSAPTPCDLLITGGTVLDLASPTGRRDAAVVVSDGRIVSVEPGPDAATRWSAGRHIDADGAYVVPGFVDGHVHLSAVLAGAQPYVPATGPSLFGGGGTTADVGRALHQFLLMPVPPEIVEVVVTPLLAAMAMAGTTAVVDAGSAGIDGIVAAARRIGVRLAVGPCIHDTLLTDDGGLETVADADEVLAAAERWVDETDIDDEDPVSAVLTVTEPTFCSDRLLAGLAELAEGRSLAITFHSYETREAVADHDTAHGRSATERLAAHGLLGPRCTLMHAGAVDDGDIEVLATTGTAVNVNPLGNAMLGFGTAAERAIARYLDAGVRLVLGSDQTPSMVASGFDLVRAALMTTREAGGADDALTLEQALAMATGGSISVGHPADLVIVDHTGPHHLGVDHPVPGLALRARPDDVRTTIVQGRIVVDDRALTTADPRELRAAAEQMLDQVRART